MQKNCAYCGNLFSFQRNTRKYCSDSCKQMAYFSRNGFTPIHKATQESMGRVFDSHAEKVFNVKDVKYSTLNGSENVTNGLEFEKVVTYAGCLMRNLLHLSEYQHIERNTFLEFTATWSQFVHWRPFKRTKLRFRYHSFMLALETKLNILAKAHRQSDLIEVLLSQKLIDQLNDSLNDIGYFENIRFSEIRF